MNAAYRDILKHSAVYGVGQILTRLASFLLLPLYTSYLRPADYGCIAILDLTAGVLGILIGSGMASAVNRYHFEAKTERERDQVWWTGLTFLVLMATIIVAPAWLMRDTLARLTLGPGQANGGYFFALVLPTLWFGAVGSLPDQYLRVRKWSGLSVGISLAQLILNIGLNVYFLVVLQLGIAGILWGNLIAGAVFMALRSIILVGTRGPYAFHRPLMAKLWRFGGPLIVTALLAMLMHQADRYLLRFFVSLDQVGIYSLAYTMGHALYALCVLPFGMIWSVAIYEIAKQPDAKSVYARVYEYFTYGLMLVLLAVSLFSRPLVALMAAPDYASAADIVPIVCLAYLFYSLSNFFRIPAMLTKRTTRLVPPSIVAVAVNLVGNILLIPRLGAIGAAWTSVLTFAVYSGVTLIACQPIDRIRFPLLRTGLVGSGLVGTFVVFEVLGSFQASEWLRCPLAALCWIVAASVLFGPLVRRHTNEFGRVLEAAPTFVGGPRSR